MKTITTTIEFIDSNNDGIPDAFENRRPIIEILNEPVPEQIDIVPPEPTNTWSSQNFSEVIRIELVKGRDLFTVIENTEERLVVIVRPVEQ